MNETTRIKRIFRNVIQRGTGRAHLLIRDYPKVNFSHEILKAAVNNYAYDPQCEGSRGPYIVELINMCTQKEILTQRVLQKLLEQKENTWGLDQLFDIARILAQAGNMEARTIFYKRLALGSLPEYACAGIYEAVELDGIEGMKRAAEVIGQVLATDYNETEDDSLIKYTQDENPGVRVEDELHKAAQTNEYIARYLVAVNKSRHQESEQPPGTALGFQFIQQIIAQKLKQRLFKSVTNRLTRKQVRELADACMLETDRARQSIYMQVFRYVKFPYGYELLLTLAQQPPRPNDRLVEDAVMALQFFKAPAIREFALVALNSSKTPSLYVDLLINHYRQGDHTLLHQLAEQAKTELEIENLASSYCLIYRKHKTKQCLKPLNKIYHRMNCGIHRGQVVEIMLRRGVLPNKIRDEVLFDSYTSVRELLNPKQA
ncbi:hypothetical protein [Hymenobacter sp. YC55]|uniref:hypothetical protein n=1 Tax=Hymenobacter sp. YC55 TaxID=3034019 RepID=UPI0023F6FA33|nr:hypothetical protein [Hymenobacter sp. YC55]MDF7812294.1 hypothetical protein [Hymenobacter sp. YC55]